MEVVGIDIGFGFTKVTNGKDSLIYKSVLGEAAEIQYQEQILEDAEKEEHLHIEVGDDAYFVGELAERQSNVRSFTLDQSQFISGFAQVLALAGLGRVVERHVPVRVVTGLPMSFYRRSRDELTKLIKAKHTVHIVNERGERHEHVINVVDVKVIPQPFGSMFNLMLNDKGEIEDRKLLHEKIGIIDVGFRTADYTICDRRKYSERGSRTTDSGIARAFTTIGTKLQEKSGVNVELYRLYEAVERSTIKIRGKTYDLKRLTEQVFSKLASDVSTEVNQLWADDWDIDTMVITGGGGAVLSPYLKPLLNGTVMSLDPGQDSRLHNVRGYWKYGKHLWTRGVQPSMAATN